MLELPVGSINTEVWRAYHLRHLATTANTLNSYLAPVRTEPPEATHRLRFRSSERLLDIFHTDSSPPMWSNRCFEVTPIEQAASALAAGDLRELAAMVHRVSVQGSRAEAAVVRK